MIEFKVRCSENKEGKYEVYCYIDGYIFYSSPYFNLDAAEERCSKLNRLVNKDEKQYIKLQQTLERLSHMIKEAMDD